MYLMIGTFFFFLSMGPFQIDINQILLRKRVFALYFRRLVRLACYFFFNRIGFVSAANFIYFDFSYVTLIENILDHIKPCRKQWIATRTCITNFIDILVIPLIFRGSIFFPQMLQNIKSVLRQKYFSYDILYLLIKDNSNT